MIIFRGIANMRKCIYLHLKLIGLVCFILLVSISYGLLYANNSLPQQEVAALYNDKLPISIQRFDVFPIANDQATQVYIRFSRPINKRQLKLKLCPDKQQLMIIISGVIHHTLVQANLDKIKTHLVKQVCISTGKNSTIITILCNHPISCKLSLMLQDVNIVLEQRGKELLKQPSFKHDKFAKTYPKIPVIGRSAEIISSIPAAPTTGALPPSYFGKRISLNFQNIAVRSLLQLIAEFAKQNIVVSDTVKGEMSLNVSNLPWQQVLNIVLRSQGLAKRRAGNVLMIAPQEEVAARELRELQAQQQAKLLLPLQSVVIRLHYAKAKDLTEVLKDESSTLLSSRGQISFDVRTNTLWVKDTAKNIVAIRRLVRRLDIPVKQVLIEARIVTLRKDYERNLGAKFGLTGAHMSGTLTGANKSINEGMKNVPPAERLNFDLSAATDTLPRPGTVGLALFKLAKNLYLDLELSALEQEGNVHIISNPRVVTANQQTATIETGEEIPYQEATSSGATSTAFKKAVLSLHITPQITPHHKIILDLQVNEDHRGVQLHEIGPPAINTQQIKTQVLLNNGETIVLGGVYKQTKQNTVTRVPFLGTIPLVGHLFKKNAKIDDRSELLIFITPRVINS
jgi:type IV pilus secretin PilQ/predicted competence protein